MDFANDGQFNQFEGNSFSGDGPVVRLRGLPWSVSEEEVISFLSGCTIPAGREGVHLTYTKDGRPSGESYVQLATQQDLDAALAKNQMHMGRRYIEVFEAKKGEMDFVVQQAGPQKSGVIGGGPTNNDAVVRLRGLPFEITKEDVAHFFTGLQIVPNGISLLMDETGRPSGDGYVQFASQAIAEKGLQKHKEKIGRRYVEIFRSSMQEALKMIAASTMGGFNGGALMGGGMHGSGMGMGRGMGGRPSPYDRYGGGARGAGRGMGGFGGRGMGNMKSVGGRGMGMGRGMTGLGAGMGRGMGRGMGTNGSGRGGMRGRGGSSGALGGASQFDVQTETGHSVHCRGLPFSASETDVAEFFSPLTVANVFMLYNDAGRPSGEADVDFQSHEEAFQAMQKHMKMIGTRYIELFLNSKEDAGSGYGLSTAGMMGGLDGGDEGYGGVYGADVGDYSQF